MRAPSWMAPAGAASALAALAVGAGGALAGCAGSPRDQVRAKVEQFAGAVASRDYATICREVLAPSLLTRLRADGVPCRPAMRVALGGVSHPTLSIGAVRVRGPQASVIVLTTAVGQRAAVSSLGLVRTSGGWRIDALGSPPAGR